MPRDWDELMDRGAEIGPAQQPAGVEGPPDPRTLTLMAAAWADLVGILAVCTGALVAILMLGERPALPAFAWAVVLGVLWWAFAAAILVVVRQGTPGMLLAGVSFAEPVEPRRVGWVVAAALVGVVTLGAIGGNAPILRTAAGSEVVEGTA